ncbi:somatostatin receptor type 5-like isoform X2 [Paramacrobiotus metropolitanus]|nr:somatostatin receptor type 5-like isoform X2 [Paramacrobiotus metropolitanus]
MADSVRIMLFHTTNASELDAVKETMSLNSTINQMSTGNAEYWKNHVPGTGNWSDSASASADLFYVVCYPFLLTLCTIGNGLNLIVLLREKKKTNANCFMTAMAVGDLVFMWSRLLRYNQLTSRILQISYNFEATLAVYPYIYYAQKWSQFLSDWVLIAFSLERLIAVVSPLRFMWLLRPFIARCAIVCLFVLAGVFQAERFATEYFRYNFNSLSPRNFPKWLRQWRDIIDIGE